MKTVVGAAAGLFVAAGGAAHGAGTQDVAGLFSGQAGATGFAASGMVRVLEIQIRPFGPATVGLALLPRAGHGRFAPPGYTLVRKRKRRARRARRGGRWPECKSWKYHGAERIDRPYDPGNYVYTEEYKRNPDRPSRREAARIAEERFPQLVNDKVLRMLELVNRVRTRRGHTSMKLEPRLMVAAKRHNLDIARYGLMQHTGTDCSQLADRVWDTGYTWTKIAENLAGGNATAAATLRQWTSSQRHLMQMTLPGMTEAGIAYDYNPSPPRSGIPIKHFWTLILARPDPWRDQRWKKPEKCKGINC